MSGAREISSSASWKIWIYRLDEAEQKMIDTGGTEK